MGEPDSFVSCHFLSRKSVTTLEPWFQGSAKLITLVVGGARSGKSRYAQALAKTASTVAFLATAQPCDDEMRAKIERHRAERPSAWHTVEVPVELDAAIARYGNEYSFLIVDCLTIFIANLLDAEHNDEARILAGVDRVCHALQSVSASVVLVSNEVGGGIVPMHPVGRLFRDLLGETNQKVSAIADNVILMVAGCPLALKGRVEVRL
jgi:adenosylcobinamide kinase / adenosylcobinamide-phosphate guanylyltransferase